MRVLVEFTKMNGAGNDFVMIDNRKLGLQLSTEQIQTLCHRQRGVGADGVLLLREAKGYADLGWDFFNQDGMFFSFSLFKILVFNKPCSSLSILSEILVRESWNIST